MFPIEVFFAYTSACILLVLSPGPDNILAIARGVSQGKLAASVSGTASGIGILFHVVAATAGLTLLIQTSVVAFYVIKFIGASYLIWLGIKVLRNRDLILIESVEKKPLSNIFVTGFLSAALNPKPGLFVLAFIPQFVNPELGSVSIQMIVYGFWFALMTTAGFSLMGIFSHRLKHVLQAKPRLQGSLNICAGLTFVTAGLAVVFMKQK
ncbi:LysE family translocator [Pseudoalteromonas luteoviolacea]|uniref:Amino acid transporter LysE n=1 Tax=Pseudoalteromonas luteoviolacea NCIMB 1942 TaxID=1365253 RepID=A0A167BXM3_9GAMM|nr:LysE family translocator [Pseudoalteromonas luteoviolacea]KZN47014.1 hypothetical protein N482_02015 [Pseudoalteromonas luteoviolacea NCIMB 1942]KZW99400.1 amino acid transporter LysE [Pseudoalteromonas luteoviolacea]